MDRCVGEVCDALLNVICNVCTTLILIDSCLRHLLPARGLIWCSCIQLHIPALLKRLLSWRWRVLRRDSRHRWGLFETFVVVCLLILWSSLISRIWSVLLNQAIYLLLPRCLLCLHLHYRVLIGLFWLSTSLILLFKLILFHQVLQKLLKRRENLVRLILRRRLNSDRTHSPH